MTFFANSGVSWPKYENDTKRAGTLSLNAFSQIWKLLAELESRSEALHGSADFTNSAESLKDAANTYDRMAEDLRDVSIAPLTPAEFELAGINLPSRRFYSDDRYLSDSFFGLFIEGSVVLGRLYKELSQRTAILASSMRAFEIQRSNADLVPQAFQFMKQIEVLATLGRVIAVLNQRNPQTE